MFQGQTFQPGTITEDMMRFTGQPVAQIARLPGTPEPPRMFTDQLTGKQVTQAEVDSLGGMQTFLDPNAEKARAKRVTAANLRHEQTIREGNIGNLIGFSGPSGGQFGQEMPMPMMQTMGPESFDRQNQEQYIPVPPGQVYQKATYGTPTPDFSRPLVEDKKFGIVESRIGQVAPPRQFEYDGPGPSMGYQLRNAQMTQPPRIDEQMNSPQYQSLLNRYQVSRGQDKDALGQLEEYQSRFAAQPPQQRGGMFNQPQQRGGMFNQQNQFNPQGMQQMMQFMQQMMQMFSMMGGQNRGGGFGGGFGGQQQYQQPQRYQPQQYQPPPRQQFQPVQQQYGQQMQPQQSSPFAQSIRPRY